MESDVAMMGADCPGLRQAPGTVMLCLLPSGPVYVPRHMKKRAPADWLAVAATKRRYPSFVTESDFGWIAMPLPVPVDATLQIRPDRGLRLDYE